MKCGSLNEDLSNFAITFKIDNLNNNLIMKTRILIASLMAASLSSFAQAPAQSDAVKQKCAEDNSMFYNFAKQKDYQDALQPWQRIYATCPDYSKNIYKYGVDIIKWQMSKETDATKKTALFNKLMKLYDDRILYFGTDDSWPANRILGAKAEDYINGNTPADPLKKQAYNWLDQSIKGMGKNADPDFIQYYIWCSCNIYRKDNTHATQLIKDYMTTDSILAINIADTTNAEVSAAYKQVKDANDQSVASTGALKGETLDKIYASKVEGNKKDIDYLVKTLNLYKAVGATESPVYFSASRYAHEIRPTEESAVGCANMYLKEKSYSKAIDYLEDATKYATSNRHKAEYQYTIATIYHRQGSMGAARAAARRSLGFNPNQGNPYILIASMYASSRGIYSDPILSKSVYWAAVDQLMKAKKADPSVAGEANRLISAYSRNFPSKEEMFQDPRIHAGSSFTVGGWIGETTRCR